MASKIHALVYEFYQALIARDILSDILGLNLFIDEYTDSPTLLTVMAKNSSTMENFLQIDANKLRESHSNGDVIYLAWIPGSQNVSDGLTKGLIYREHTLCKLMTNITIEVKQEGCVEGTD